MTLIGLAATNPEAFTAYNIQQIVTICGDGHLTDGSGCSQELRGYLRQQSTQRLAQYARFCLDRAFSNSGLVLQDIVNEIGRRLGFQVTDGRYSGSTREIAFDGIWTEGSASLVVEAKTSDAFRINLDKVVAYARRAKADGMFVDEPSVLLVVGREDTGDLEAQIRGSRHAWQVRLVSVESLIKLMLVRDEAVDKAFTEKIRRILFPIEYTRVDNIIELVFETQREVEDKIVEPDAADDASEENGGAGWQFTPTTELDAKRNELLRRFFEGRALGYRRVSRSMYIGDQKNVRVACTISKRYDRDYQPYWYAFHPTWLEFMEQATDGFLLLGCMDRDKGIALPLQLVKSKLDSFNQTENPSRRYWHIALQMDDGSVFLNMSRTGERIPLSSYEF